MAGPIRIAILADAAQARREIDQTSQSFGDKLGSASKKASLALAGLGAAGVGAALKAEEVASANARVGNVLSNMGMDAATERTLAYAESLEKSLAIDGEVIKNTQAKLATFEALAKTADQAGGMFDRATVAAADLAAAGFGSVESNAAQLGKALQDPIKGLTALTKSGVTFSEAEKEKIKVLTESGQLAKAQGIVMAAIEKQVGGTAAATADSSMKMRLAFENVIESVGMMLLPMLDRLAAVAQQVADVAAAHPQVFMAVATAIGAVSAAIVIANAAYKAYLIVTKAVAIASKAWAAAQWVLNAALSANPIGLIVIAIAALVAAFVVAWKRSETFRNLVIGTWNAIKAAASAVWGAIVKVIEVAWKGIKLYVTTYVKVVRTVVTTAWNVIRTVTVTAWNTIKRALQVAWTAISGVVRSQVAAVRTIVTGAWNAVRAVTTGVWNAVKNSITTAVNNIVRAVTTLKGKVTGAISGAIGWLKSAGSDVIRGFISGITSMGGSIISAIKSTITDKLPGYVKKALGIESPSKVFAAIGRDVVRGFEVGILKNAQRAEKATERMLNAIGKAVKDKDITKAAAARMRATVNAIANEAGRLNGLIAKRVSLASDVTSSLRDELDLSELLPANAWAAGGSPNTYVAGLVARMKTFADKIRRLTKAGIPTALISEIAGMGSKDGAKVADTFLGLNVGQRRSLASSYRGFEAATAAAGAATGNAVYGAAINRQRDVLEDKDVVGLLREILAETRQQTRNQRGDADKLARTVNTAARYQANQMRKGVATAGQNRRRDGGRLG